MKIKEHTTIRELKSTIESYDEELEILILEKEYEENFSYLFEYGANELFALAESLNIVHSDALTRDLLIAEIIKKLQMNL